MIARPLRFPGAAATCAPSPPARSDLAALLRTERLVSPERLMQALSTARRDGGRLSDIVIGQGLMDERGLHLALSRHWGLCQIDPLALPPDPALVATWGPARALREMVLPWRQTGGATMVLAARPEDFARSHAALTETFGPVQMALAPAAGIEAAVLALAGVDMALAAEHSVPVAESSRSWGGPVLAAWGLVALAALVLATWLSPGGVVIGLAAWTILTMIATVGLKFLALLAAARRVPDGDAAPVASRLPVVSVMVALYRESDIAPRLVRRLERIDYPRDLLDVVLVVEQGDALTRDALASAGLPPWMRVVAVPPGRVKTKPRALNYALGLCRGSIIGVYDAEDAPAPDQIRRVVQRFHERGPQVVCLQGVLDFYNPRANWLARCFTMEYAAWFRVVLPGIARLGLPVPLGGTTLFFRRHALEDLGAWDAWNVTEDADLGIRLCRHGFRTELIDTVTEEEANCRAWPWVKQRSRWLKGYMMTWAVHMRDPALLYRQLGRRGFWGFQVLFLGTLSQFVLAPVLWSFWLATFGLWHPVIAALPPWGGQVLVAMFLLTEAVTLAAGWLGMRRTAHRFSPLWLLTLHVYFPLGSLASYKAAWEMVRAPFYWDKTAHGTAAPQAPVPDAADLAEPARIALFHPRPRPTAPAANRAPVIPPAPATDRATALDRARRLHPHLLDKPVRAGAFRPTPPRATAPRPTTRR